MDTGIVTVGDELLSGTTANTNATWLATQLTDRGVTVQRITVVPDDRPTIAEAVSWFSGRFDATIVTGGLGNTPDDVTMAAVAEAFETSLGVNERARADVTAAIEAYRSANPEVEIDVDIEQEATLPERSRAVLNGPGLSPGCVLDSVYVLPGIPAEMRAMFESVADAFSGTLQTRTLYTTDPEAMLTETLQAVMEEFDVTVGCYPENDNERNRLTLSGTDAHELTAAADWLRARVTVVTE